MPIARLTDRAVIAAGGPGAEAFLQGLVTNAVAAPRAGWSTYAALLTPQGKVQFDFVIHGAADGYLIDVAAAKADELLKRLKMYRLRAPVTLEPRPEFAVFAAWETATLSHPRDPRLEALGERWVAPSDDAVPVADLAAYEAHRLTLGVPDSGDVEGEFALDANFEELHGVDFRKGCFVGQEVTARMKHKAQPRRRIVPVVVEGGVERGAKLIDASGLEVGEVTSAAGGVALASVKLDRLRDASGLNANGRPATLTVAAYVLPVANPN